MVLDYVKLKDIKPALSGYISDSLSLLRRSPVPDEDAVHDVRVLMKKSRASLKLVKTQLDEESFQREYLACREAGRMLTGWRETYVYRKTFKSLRKDNRELFARLSDIEKISLQLAKQEPASELPPALKSEIEAIDDHLNKSLYRMRFHSLSNLDAQLLLKELEQTYTVVAHNYLKCRNNPKPEWLHEFRKRAKDFLYQLYFFRPLNPSVVKHLEKKLDCLTQDLGKYNDLSQIVNYLEYRYGDPANSPALDELMILIRDRQDKYLEEVWPVAYKIFCPGQKLLNVLGFRMLVI
jgi:CHAD domain-containing protein